MPINQEIRGFIERNLSTMDDEVIFSDEDNIFEMRVVNSLFAMKLINYLEKEFNIRVDFEDLEIDDVSSVNNIINFIHSRQN